MSNYLEIEKTYLAKSIPVDLSTIKNKRIVDIYIPKNTLKPSIRLRQMGINRYDERLEVKRIRI